MLLNLGDHGLRTLTCLINKVAAENKIPKDWQIGIIIPLYKKNSRQDCNNYRGITLLSIPSKVYERLLDIRLKRIIDSDLEEAQSGFRKGRGVQNHIFAIKQMIEKNFKGQIFVAFIDLEKAFDSIPRRTIWNNLKRRGVDARLLNNIASIYKQTRNYIRTNNRESEEFVTNEGVRQGGVLSPTLFNIVLDDVIKEIKPTIKKLLIGYRNMEPIYVTEMAFADDLMICAKSEEDLQYNLDKWYVALKRRNLKINIDKTKIMIMGNTENQTTINLDSKEIKQANSFKYLGVTIQENGKNEAEINNRIESAIKLYYTLNKTFIWKKEISKKTKMTVYKTIVKPILTYGCESWTLSNQQKSKIQAVEMKFLRGIKGITKRDRKRNKEIRDELEVESILSSIERQQLRWFGHLTRMSSNRQVKKIWGARPIQKQSRGRPKKTWNDVIVQNLTKRNKTWTEGNSMAKNKKQWAKFIYEN